MADAQNYSAHQHLLNSKLPHCYLINALFSPVAGACVASNQAMATTITAFSLPFVGHAHAKNIATSKHFFY
jgi:hypothetical protein